MKRPAVLSTAPAATAWPSHAPPTRAASATGRPHAEQVERRQRDDEGEREEPALERRQRRMPVPEILDEQRRIDGDVDEAVEPRPPADLEAPERPEGARRPRHVAALVGHRGGQLRHRERDGQAPEQRREQEQHEGEAGTERRHRVLDAVGAAAHVEEDDGGERHHAELPPEAHLTAAISAGSSWSHSPMGRAASTVISSLPFGRRRTRPGAAGPSGMTSDSRWMPRASVTPKIASISFIVTTSSTDADLARARGDLPPRLVLDGDAFGSVDGSPRPFSMIPDGTVSPRLNLTRSLPSAQTLEAKSCDIAIAPPGPGIAMAWGFVPRRLPLPPHGATFRPLLAFAHSMPTRPSAASVSA